MDLDAIPAAGYDRIELLQVADAVAREKSIEREEVIEAMEQAIQKAARSKYGQEHDVRAVIDRKSGDIRLARYLEVVEEVEDDLTQITPDEARKKKADAEVGEFLIDPLPPMDFGRIAATMVSRILGIPVYDTQCGAKLFLADRGLQTLFEEPFVTRWAFDVEILARWLIHRDAGVEVNRSIIEAPLDQWIDVAGSKLTAVDFLRAPTDLWRIRRRYGAALREQR